MMLRKLTLTNLFVIIIQSACTIFTAAIRVIISMICMYQYLEVTQRNESYIFLSQFVKICVGIVLQEILPNLTCQIENLCHICKVFV